MILTDNGESMHSGRQGISNMLNEEITAPNYGNCQ